MILTTSYKFINSIFIMELNNSILGINTQDVIINDIFKNDVQYTHITGSVNLCVNRCGQEIDHFYCVGLKLF